ncbi:MAG: ABC1 kinase family protein, partial [Acidimicrobiales bacterium]
VKVQRPNIAAAMSRDLRIGYRLAGWFDRTPWGRHAQAQRMVEDLHRTTFQELNPALEAHRQHQFRNNIGAFGDNTMMTAPEIYWEHCGPRIICMERVEGIPMDHFDELDARGVDGEAMLRRGAKVWAESVMVHGPFHGDLHAGNLWALDDGRLCFLDFGIVGELNDEWKQVLKDLFYTCMFDRNFTRIAAAFRRMGVIPADSGTDEDLGAMLASFLGGVLDDGFGSLDIAALVVQALEIAKSYDGAMPPEMALISKQLLYIDRYTKRLAPTYSLTSDPYVVQNIFPTEAHAKAEELGIDLAVLA